MNTVLLVSATALSLLAGVHYGSRAKRHPELFWTYLAIGLVFTSPFAIGGYTWYDEAFASGYLLANLPGRLTTIQLSFPSLKAIGAL